LRRQAAAAISSRASWWELSDGQLQGLWQQEQRQRQQQHQQQMQQQRRSTS
jgi:hypothetical protein